MTRFTLAGVLVMALLVSDAGAQLRATPITNPETLYELEGYSVTAPPGKDWFELQRDRNTVFFGKKVASRTHAFIATALSTSVVEKFEKPEEFREFVVNAPLVERDPRSRLIENRVELDASVGRYCVRFYTKALDRGAVSARGYPLVLETYGVSCLHPADSSLAVTVSYSERGLVAETSSDLLAQGERFVGSLKFIELKP